MKPVALLALAALPALAQDWQTPESIRAAALEAARALAPAGAQLDAQALDPRLRLPACGRALAGELSPNAALAASLNVAVRCEAPTAWTLYVPVRVTHRKPVLILRRAVAPGETITAEMLDTQERDVAALHQGHLVDLSAAVGQRVVRSLPAGAVLPPGAIAPPLVVRRGDAVTVQAQAGVIQVRSQGKALADAALGQPVTVENSSSRQRVQGIARGAGLVEVRL